MLPSTLPTRRIIPIVEWAPAQEAMYEEEEGKRVKRRNSMAFWHEPASAAVPPAAEASNQIRARSKSLTLNFFQRPKTPALNLEYDDDGDVGGGTAVMERGKSHEWEPARGRNAHAHDIKGIFRRASMSLKSGMRELVHRRTSYVGPVSSSAGPSVAVAGPSRTRGSTAGLSAARPSTVRVLAPRAGSCPPPPSKVEFTTPSWRRDGAASHSPALDNEFVEPNQPHLLGGTRPPMSSRQAVSSRPSLSRPSTSQSTWNRLKQATSFHRHARQSTTAHGERAFLTVPPNLPSLPVPGSSSHPPFIPPDTGFAARRAAAIASRDQAEHAHADPTVQDPLQGMSKLTSTDAEEALNDDESGIGIGIGISIALTSSEAEAMAPSDDADSDVDVGVVPSGNGGASQDIVKIDFVTRLPLEVVIMLLSQLDAAGLAVASRVCRAWYEIAKNKHIWRESFLRAKAQTYAAGARVKPGTGQGVPPLDPANDWKDIYRVREQLDRNWDAGALRPTFLNGHQDSIYCVQFDEHKIVTGSRDRTIRVWDMHTFECKLVIGPPNLIHPQNGVVLLFDGAGMPKHFASMPFSPLDYPLAPGTHRPQNRGNYSVPRLRTFPMHHDASILSLQYDDEILVTGSSDNTCIVHDVRAGYQPLRRLVGHEGAVLDLVFDAVHIVTCSKDATLCVWSRGSGALLRVLRGHIGPVNSVQMRGNTIVSCSGDTLVKLWNADTGRNIAELAGHEKGLACSQFSEDGRLVASAGNDRQIRLWDANTGDCLRALPRAHDNLVRSLHIDSVAGRLVSASYDTGVKVWDLDSGALLRDLPRWHTSWVLSARSDYRRIVSTGQDAKILILDFGAWVEGVEMLESRRAGEGGA